MKNASGSRSRLVIDASNKKIKKIMQKEEDLQGHMIVDPRALRLHREDLEIENKFNRMLAKQRKNAHPSEKHQFYG